jgi:hypothetical protein
MSETPITSISSILAVDFGSVHTRALLFDVVDGEYRLVARGQTRTTIGFPIDDVNIGVGRILKDISEATGRRFFNERGQIITPEQSDRSGVDHYITTASAGRPIQVVMVGLVPNISIASALRATSASYIEPVAEIHLEDGLSEEERINHIILSRPDLIFISGGTDGGAKSALLDLLNLLQLAVKLIPEQIRPTVLYAGNKKLADKAKDLLGDLTKVLISPNVRPTEEEEELEPAQILLGQAYDEHKERHGFSFRNVASMTSSGILPTAQGFATLTEFFAQTLGENALSIDVGSTTTVLSMSVHKDINTAVRTDIGMGHSAYSLLQGIDEESITEWLPFYLQPDELVTYTLNKRLRPATVPMNLREMYIEHALLRAGIRYMLSDARLNWDNLPLYDDMPHIGLIIGAGATLTGTGYSALDMLLMVDAIQPTGVTHIKADPHGVIPALGALALREPNAVVQLIDDAIIDHLGTVISVSGNPSIGSRAMNLKITTDDGEEFEHEIEGGRLWLLPLPENVSLNVQIKLSRGLTIGNKSKLKINLHGGQAGVLFDARGRSLSMGATPEERAENMPHWFATVTEQDPVEIPASWLVAPEVEHPEDEQPEKETKKSRRRRRREKEKEEEKPATLDKRMATITGKKPELEEDFPDLDGDDEDLEALFGDDETDDERGSLRDLIN